MQGFDGHKAYVDTLKAMKLRQFSDGDYMEHRMDRGELILRGWRLDTKTRRRGVIPCES